MNEAEGEAAETQVWLEYAVKCGYIRREDGTRLHKVYDMIIGKAGQHGKSTSEVAAQTDETVIVLVVHTFTLSHFQPNCPDRQ